MYKPRISTISYSNSCPFLWGLLNSDIINTIDLAIDYPAVCADKLLSNKADVGIVPIVETLRLKHFEIVTDICISSNDYVRTVMLVSNCPLENIERVYLDYQSRSSVTYVKILAKHYWKQKIEWINAIPGYETQQLQPNSGALIIGDRAFSANHPYQYDIAHEWKMFSGLPFITAAWVATNFPKEYHQPFGDALHYGLNHIPEAVAFYKSQHPTDIDIISYLNNNISYTFDSEKQKAYSLFIEYAREFVNQPK